MPETAASCHQCESRSWLSKEHQAHWGHTWMLLWFYRVLLLQLMESRFENWLSPRNFEKDRDFSLGSWPQPSAYLSLFLLHILSNIFAACPSLLPLVTPCSLSHICRSCVQGLLATIPNCMPIKVIISLYFWWLSAAAGFCHSRPWTPLLPGFPVL